MNSESVCVQCYWRTKNSKYSKIYLRDKNIPGQFMWNLWWIKWHWDSFSHVLQFFPIGIIPPVLHIYLFICHQSYIRGNLSNWQHRKITHLTLGLTVRSKFVCFGVQVLILCLVVQAVLIAHKHEPESPWSQNQKFVFATCWEHTPAITSLFYLG